jgi:hypothetical protein
LVVERSSAAQAVQEGRGACAATHRIDQQVGVELALRATVAVDDVRTGDSVCIRCDRIDEVMAVEDFDVVDSADALPDVRLQQRAAQQVQLDGRGVAEFARSAQLVAGQPNGHPRQVAVVADLRACGDQVVMDAGEQSRQFVGATTPQHVEVAALRNSAALVGSIRQLVPFDHRHRAVKLAEHPSGEQPAHPRTADDGLLSQLAHRLPPADDPAADRTEKSARLESPIMAARKQNLVVDRCRPDC